MKLVISLKNNYYSKTETDAAIKIESDKIDSIVHRVDTIDSISNEAITQATQTADKFNWLVKSGTSATDFTLTDRTATLISQYINLNGLVTFSGLNSETQSKITNASTNALNAISKADSANTLLSFMVFSK